MCVVCVWVALQASRSTQRKMTASWTGPSTLGSHDLQSWWERVPLVYDLRIIAITQRFLGPDLQTTILRLPYDNAEVNTIDLRRGRLYRVGRKPGCFES